MKNNSQFLLLLFLFFSCNEKQPKENKSDQVIIECQKIFKEWNIEANISKEDKPNDYKIFIEIIKPIITHNDHASIIASCLVVKNTSFPKSKTITVSVFSKKENKKNLLSEITYSQHNIKSLIALYGDAPLLRLNEYCIKAFDPHTPNDLETLMAKNHTLEKWSLEGSFFQLVYQFFKESKGYEKSNSATMTIFFLYLTTSDFLKGSELEYLSIHLQRLWKITRNEDIRNYEKEFVEIMKASTVTK